jgi:[CysO sulfur-carrier protein]-S-L-cysteine hydrolase
MVAQAVAEAPLECCGLLAGPAFADGQATVAARYPLLNAAESPTEYDADPASLFAAVKQVRRRGWDVLAVYHSHPTSPPVPSRTDLARSYWAGVVHFIISLQSSQPEVRGWWLTETDYREASWAIADD